MAASPEQERLIAVDGLLGTLATIDGYVRDVQTRIANRARTPDEADDIRLLIACRGEVGKLKCQLQALTRYARS